jgi:hypothetical protein
MVIFPGIIDAEDRIAAVDRRQRPLERIICKRLVSKKTRGITP